MKIIEEKGSVAIGALKETFYPREHFKDSSDEVMFYQIWANFFQLFLCDSGCGIEPNKSHKIFYGDAKRNSSSNEMIKCISRNHSVATVTLWDIFYLLKKQSGGKKGPLLTDGLANIFHVRDCGGKPRTVVVYFDACGWDIDASSTEDPRQWRAGSRIFYAAA